jgi:hypothetical protein
MVQFSAAACLLLSAVQMFKYAGDAPLVTKFGLQSHFSEPGERSYMRDNLGVQVCVDSLPSQATWGR